ncbi:MAG: prepilin-type N-terminal cleavage/methylation domain-containing protein [Opitutaceae bacterium]|jgi:prepilin-type processing-associated H-X9-DG protein/prepilin-type N-terminal cleavage/methylation domain-containing protein|nr:prepilin-type N-terminal cleavage/methylation domain-containing protein [Opitutaceae bacterium]
MTPPFSSSPSVRSGFTLSELREELSILDSRFSNDQANTSAILRRGSAQSKIENPKSKISRAWRAFTLIELLTAVAIIGVLATLSFSALGNIRKKARAAVCASNLRQCGVALNLYANDNKGNLPAALENDAISWPVELGRRGYLPRLVENQPTVATCPVSTSRGRYVKDGFRRVYGMWTGNANYGTKPPPPAVSNRDVQCYRLSIQSLEPDRIIVADSGRSVYSEGWDPSYFIMTGTGKRETSDANKVINLCHGGKANALFVDGHVKAVDAAWLLRDARYNWTSHD